jgi:hypothetical protein
MFTIFFTWKFLRFDMLSFTSFSMYSQAFAKGTHAVLIFEDFYFCASEKKDLSRENAITYMFLLK